MILTDAKGVPFKRPRREDFQDDVSFIHAFHEYRDKITNYANAEFAASLTDHLDGRR